MYYSVVFICYLPLERFEEVMHYSVAILSDCMGSNLAIYSSYYTFYFIGVKNNFKKPPDYIPSVFPNKQGAKRVVTPSQSICSIRRNYRHSGKW